MKTHAVVAAVALAFCRVLGRNRTETSTRCSIRLQDNTAGRTVTAFKRGGHANANLLYALSKNVLNGLEFVWGDLEPCGGQSATDSRLQFSTQVTF